jgi:gluconolactonase
MIHRIFVFILVSSFSLPAADPVPEFHGTIERLDPALDKLIAPDAKIEVLASGFNWSEGPVWRENGIVFSDVPENTVFGWKEGDKAANVVLKPSGSLSDPAGQGSNGLALDAAGNLVLCQHGERRVARLEKDDSFTSLADKYDGKRFNSPNDLVIAKDGMIYFTDPPYGLKKGGAAAELAFHGVYSVTPAGKVSLLISDIAFPNGIALSPDQKTLYIAISDPKHTRLCAYDLQADGSAKNGRVFFDAQNLKSKERKGGCDGMKVDTEGNIWTTGPGGVLVISKEGKHLGTILTGQATANCAFGGEDRGTLYITADMFLLRVRTLAKGL